MDEEQWETYAYHNEIAERHRVMQAEEEFNSAQEVYCTDDERGTSSATVHAARDSSRSTLRGTSDKNKVTKKAKQRARRAARVMT